MNYLFTFKDWINVIMLAEFEIFINDLDLVCWTTSANDDQDEEPLFPHNFMMVYVDTDDQNLLEIITNKYNRLIADDPDQFIRNENSPLVKAQ